MSLGAAGFERKTKRTRKREFLDEMNLVVPWAELLALIAPHAPQPGAKGEAHAAPLKLLDRVCRQRGVGLRVSRASMAMRRGVITIISIASYA